VLRLHAPMDILTPFVDGSPRRHARKAFGDENGDQYRAQDDDTHGSTEVQIIFLAPDDRPKFEIEWPVGGS
jgi:hypothetical protein